MAPPPQHLVVPLSPTSLPLRSLLFALIISFFQRYDPRAGIGTLVATMLPYSLSFLAVWSGLFALWLRLDLPLGPGAPAR